MTKRIRQLHLMLGIFFAPTIIFFSFTGAIQTFGLHEAKGTAFRPPQWVIAIAEVHKHQRLKQPQLPEVAIGNQERPGESTRPQQTTITEGDRATYATLALRYFVLLMTVGLITTTLLGIYMAFKYNRDKRVVCGLLFLGTSLPIAVLFL